MPPILVLVVGINCRPPPPPPFLLAALVFGSYPIWAHFDLIFAHVPKSLSPTAFGIPEDISDLLLSMHPLLEPALLWHAAGVHNARQPSIHCPFLHFGLLEGQSSREPRRGPSSTYCWCRSPLVIFWSCAGSRAHRLGDLNKWLTSENPSCLLLKVKIKPTPYLSGLLWGLNEVRNVKLFW